MGTRKTPDMVRIPDIVRVLVVEDSAADAELEARELKRAGLRLEMRVVEREDDFRRAVAEFAPHVILSDFSMPSFSGMDALAIAREIVPEVPFIFVSGTLGEEYAIRALKNGATDYVLKTNLVRLPAAIERALQDVAQRAARREAESMFRDVVQFAPDPMVVFDAAGKIVLSNAQAEALFGRRRDELAGQPVENLVPQARGPAQGAHDGFAVHRDGRRIPVQVNLAPLGHGDAQLAVATIRDLTERRAQEARIARLSRVRDFTSSLNSTLVRLRERGALFAEVCRVAQQSGQFPLVFVAMVDRREQQIRAVAWAGEKPGFAGLSRPTVGVQAAGRPGLSAQAIASGAPAVCNDIEADGAAMRYAKEALEHGYRAAAALPLVVDGAAIGALVLYAAERRFFDDEEMKLLVELAGNISFALEHVEKERKISRLSRVNAVLSGINGAIVRIRDREELLRESCRIAVEAGLLRLAWIGVVDRRTEDLLPVASSGCEEGFLGIIRLSTRADSERFGLAGRAFRDRKPVISNDLLADAQARFRKESAERGFRSLAMIPLLVHGEARGVIGLHAGEPGFFDQAEMRLLTEVAGNIAFALEHIEKQDRIERLTRVYAVLSGINGLIVRARQRDELFREACRIAVEHGRFPLAWIGLVSRAEMQIKPVAWAGKAEGYLERMPLALNAALPQGRGVTAQAIREMKAMVANDMATDARIFTKDEALARGFRSLAVLPLVAGGEAIGVLSLYADKPGFFDDEELKLLTELAGDISFALEHIAKADQLDYLAYYDSLTGLANRTLFLERLSQNLSAAGRERHSLALMIFDIERFKTINDAFGRQTGDALLKQVGARLAELAGSPMQAARIGADQFALVIPHVHSEQDLTHHLEEASRRLDGQAYVIDGADIRISTRAGVALFPADGADADSLFRNAEAALKRSKSGDRYVFYAKEMTERVAEKLALENRLRKALENEEFVLHYQPKVDLDTRSIVGVEALIRWQSPDLGLVPPIQFIPLMEETGLILQAGAWALKRAALDHRRWVEQGVKGLRVAVNVSAIQLRQRDFVETVEQAIIDGLAPTGIDLEITESVIMEDIQRTVDKLESVRKLGVRIAIDDFGTGYSSLAYLARLPVAALKIDRSFVIKMLNDLNTATLVQTMISLAHSLSLKVVAEGVDSEEQARVLRLLRCDEMQGYLFSKPLPVEQLSALLGIGGAATGS